MLAINFIGFLLLYFYLLSLRLRLGEVRSEIRTRRLNQGAWALLKRPRLGSCAFEVSKILLVDDNCDLRRILQVPITRMGFESITAGTGKEAVEKAIAEKPDLILMDILMPAINGGEATRILRLIPRTKDIPILAMTALHRKSDLQQCIDAGCNDYIVKPFPIDELQRKIKALIP